MKILVCFKAAPNVEMLLDEDWVIDKKLQIDTSFVRNDLSAYDESALEMALQLSEASRDVGLNMELNALTVDGPGATPILKTLSALRFETAVRIEPGADLLFKPMAVASFISQYMRLYAPQDVVLFGSQSDIGENAKTPLLTAEMLGWPCITRATHIGPMDDKHVTVTHQVDDGHIQARVRVPCVIAVGDAPCTYLRKPTLKDRLSYGKKTIAVLTEDGFQLPGETETLMDLDILHHKRDAAVIKGDSPRAKARVLYEDYLEPLLSGKKANR